MLHSDWLKLHKKEMKVLLLLCLLLSLCLLISTVRQDRFLIEENRTVVGIERENLEQNLSLPLKVQVEGDGEVLTFDVMLSLKGIEAKTGETQTTEEMRKSKPVLIEEELTSVVKEVEGSKDLQVILPKTLADGTRLCWKRPIDLRFLLVFLLLPVCLLYIYETERQKEKMRKKQWEEGIRKALPAFLDQLLLLLNCGMIFHDAFYHIEAGYTSRSGKDAFCNLLERIRKEADESGRMVVTVMKDLSRDVGVREYVRLVNILMDHQHRGVNLEEKLQAEGRLLWEGRKAEALQKGKEMETKMTFPLALLLFALIIIAGTPALMNM